MRFPGAICRADYLAVTSGYQVEGVIWHEFLSTDAYREASWAQLLANGSKLRIALCALVEFLDPDLEHRLDQYAGSCRNTPRFTNTWCGMMRIPSSALRSAPI
jgi:hypothetical protein